MKILTIANKKEEKFLRIKTADFNFNKINKKEMQEIIKKMRKTMYDVAGIGLSANQVGLNLRMFIIQIPQAVQINTNMNMGKSEYNADANQCNQPKAMLKKFYVIFNPKIKIPLFCNKKTIMEEGCLSVPGFYGTIKRPEKIILIGQDISGKKIKIKAQGLLAKVFQHETDHLNGVLFIDKIKQLHKISK